ncbi:MAG: ParB/RepB/Spo0J family partition protein [Aureliella sp.]
MGLRTNDSKPKLSPVANAKDVGRRALRTFGTLDINSLIPDPEQPRREFDEAELELLAESLKEKGQLHPIRVRWSEQHSKWIIISGERRFRASRIAGLPSVQCHFVDDHLSKSEILEQQLIENLVREDLKPLEEARAFEALREVTGWTSKQLAESISVTPSKVTRSLSLLKLPEDIQERVEAGLIASSTAYELSKLSNVDQMRAALQNSEASASTQLTVTQARKQVSQRRGKAKPKSRGVKQTFSTAAGPKIVVTSSSPSSYEAIEQALEEALDEVRHRIENNVQL